MDTDKIIAEKIASEYAPKETSRLVALKKLDRKAKLPGRIFAYTWGICFTLIMGLGMSLSMQVLGNETWKQIVGIVLGLLGILGVSVNYYFYKKIIEKGKKKYAYDIMVLANEIAKEE